MSSPEPPIASVRAWIEDARRIVILTGAGISTESGIPDFRGPQGVWTKDPQAEKLSNIHYYVADPEIRRKSWRARLAHPAWTARPNAGHAAIVELERRGKLHALITQNIDGLHQKAGNSPERVIEVHGTVHTVVCLSCGWKGPMQATLDRVRSGESDPPCGHCGGSLESDTISFGPGLAAAAGYGLVAHDVDRDALKRARDATGAEAPESLKATAERCEAVITMLPGGDAVRAVVLGPGDCLLAGFPRGSVLIDMSSSSPLGTRGLGARLAERGVAMLDSPVSGGVRKAADATLSIMVGGDAQIIARCRPILEAMGRQIFMTGPLGSWHAMKALNNYVSAAGLVAATEGVLAAQRFGLDPGNVVGILNASTGMNNSTLNKFHRFILSRAFY